MWMVAYDCCSTVHAHTDIMFARNLIIELFLFRFLCSSCTNVNRICVSILRYPAEPFLTLLFIY